MKTLFILILGLTPAGVLAQNHVAEPLDDPTSGSAQTIPFGGFPASSGNFDETRSHFYWPAAYLPPVGGNITAIEIVPFSSSTGSLFYQLLEISMDHTTNPGLSTTFASNLTSPTVVFSLNNQTFSWTAGVWNAIPLQTPFPYDGASSLVIEVRKILDRPNNPPAVNFSHNLLPGPNRTDLVPPVWVFGTYGSGASSAATATVVYPTELLMRLQFGTANTLTIDSTRSASSGAYFNIGGTATLTNQGPAGALYATFWETTLLGAGFPVPPVNGEFWLLTPLYPLTSGTLDPAGRGSFSIPIPNVLFFAGVTTYMQSLIVGPSFDFTNVVTAPLAR